MRQYAPTIARQECLVDGARGAYSLAMRTNMKRLARAAALWCALSSCAGRSVSTTPAPVAPPVNTADLAIASDAVADSLLADVHDLDPTIAVTLRYATSDNFTGAPLPGYLANRAFLRREAAVALARVQRRLRADGLGLKVF